jgi:hypothetical protein
MPRPEGDSYPRSIAAALMMNVDAVVTADLSGLCGTVIGTIALLSAEGVPRNLLHGIAEPAHLSTDAIEHALEQCVDGSVLSWSFNGDAVIMHRLMARVLWERYRAENIRCPSDWSAGLDRTATVRRISGLEPSARGFVARLACRGAVGGVRGRRSSVTAPTERALATRQWAVRQLIAAVDLTRAITLAEKVATDAARLFGTHHPESLMSRSDLARAYESAGRTEEAVALHESVVADAQRKGEAQCTCWLDLSRVVQLAVGSVQVARRGVVVPRRRLPLRIQPLAGEAVDSWLEATAAHMDTTVGVLARMVGLSVARRPAWSRWIGPYELNALEAATGVSAVAIQTMTLQSYDTRA